MIFFGIKQKINNFDPYNVLLAIITNIPVLLTTAFEVQVHICALSDLHFCAFGVFLIKINTVKQIVELD